MRIVGCRDDGTFLVAISREEGVLLRGNHVTRATRIQLLVKMGPWQPTDDSVVARVQVRRALHKARQTPVEAFDVGGTR